MARMYNPKEVICSVAGVIVEGFAEGTFLEVTTTEDMHTYSGGSDGNGTFNRNPNQSGTIKFTLQHNAKSVNILSLLGGLNSMPIPIIILDNNEGGQKVLGIDCLLQKQIDVARAKEVGSVDITFIGEKVLVVPIGG